MDHVSERAGIVLATCAAPFVRIVRYLRRVGLGGDGLVLVIERASIRFGVWIGVLTGVAVSDTDPSLPNRSMVAVRAARARGLEVRNLMLFGVRPTSHFAFDTPSGTHYFDTLPIPWHAGAYIPYDDKWEFKRFLAHAGFSVPRGVVVDGYGSALRFAQEIGFPVVVKPRAGSLTKHTSVNVKTVEALREAVRIARVVSRELVVEEFIPGHVYRVTLVGVQVAAACLREAPNVTGDGVRTLRELVALKNADPRRKDFSNRNSTLHTIVPHQSCDLNHVPGHGEKVYLHEKVLMGAGGDVHDVTDVMHPDNRALCERLALAAGAPVLGIDLITRDIAVSHQDERLAILEANTMPYIDMHHYPVTGTPRNVAGMLLEAYLKSVN